MSNIADTQMLLPASELLLDSKPFYYMYLYVCVCVYVCARATSVHAKRDRNLYHFAVKAGGRKWNSMERIGKQTKNRHQYLFLLENVELNFDSPLVLLLVSFTGNTFEISSVVHN